MTNEMKMKYAMLYTQMHVLFINKGNSNYKTFFLKKDKQKKRIIHSIFKPKVYFNTINSFGEVFGSINSRRLK